MNNKKSKRLKEGEKILNKAMKKRYSFEEIVIQPLLKKGLTREEAEEMLHEFGLL